MADTESMVERVARAMFEDWLQREDVKREQLLNGPHPAWSRQGEIGQRNWLRSARAAIEAMREPTPAMLMTFLVEMVKHSDNRQALSAMIDAALAE